MRKIWILILAAALALAWGAGAARAEGDNCIGDCGENPGLREFDVERRTEGGTAREGRRCLGSSALPVMVRATEDVCYRFWFYIDCHANIMRREPIGAERVACGARAVWDEYCEPSSGFGHRDGFCQWRDYYGHRVYLRVEVPIHEFVVRPYPVGFVAREDPWGVFHPTARLVWRTPPYPAHADSGWRLWSWGGDRGPGNKPFPCNMSESELFSNQIPAGTTCIRMQLWASPGYDAGLNPIMEPGLLQFPAAGVNVTLWPEREVVVNFPYASHPATGEVSVIRFGETVLPAFNGYFRRWWPVRFRVETKKVKDIYRDEEKCNPVPDEDGDGQPDRGGDCWTTIGDPPVTWPGDKETRRVLDRKEWEGSEFDQLLDLRDFGKPYFALHSDRLRIIGPDRAWRAGYVIRGDGPWLYCPLAVREGQGVVTR